MLEEKYLVMRDRQNHLAPCYWNAVSETFHELEDYHGIRMPKYFIILDKGRHITVYERDDWKKCEDYFAGKLLNDKFLFQQAEEKTKKSAARINEFVDEFFNKNLSDLKTPALYEFAFDIQKHWIDYDRLTVPFWFWGGDKFKAAIEEKLQLEKEDFLSLTTPPVKTAVSQMEYELLKGVKDVINGLIPIRDVAQKLSRQYGWIPFGYDGPEYWVADHFQAEIESLIKNPEKLDHRISTIDREEKDGNQKRSELEKKNGLTSEDLRLIEVINTLAIWTDDRKQLQFQLHYLYDKVLLELSSRFVVPHINLKYLFTEELELLENDKKKALETSDWRIMNPFVIKPHDNRLEILSGIENDIFLQELKEQQDRSKDIKGVVASRGKGNVYRGVAKILLSPKESGKIKAGDILVVTMTTPDYIIAMQKAGGFVTDEGGVTSHAAIVAREMKKPCIIGTKNATRLIKNGDSIEMDMKQGIVRILK